MSVILTGESLTIEELVSVARNKVDVQIAESARKKVQRCRNIIAEILSDYEAALDTKSEVAIKKAAVYGVTTGFGEFKTILLEKKELAIHAENILKSHAVGFGENEDADDPVNYFPAEVVRAALVIRLNAILKGHSGVRLVLVDLIATMINEGIVPLVPTRGSVGSSGDLCPLAHTFATLLGHGHYYIVKSTDDIQWGLRVCQKMPASKLLEIKSIRAVIDASTDESSGWVKSEYEEKHGFTVRDKEGLALTNGATYSAAMLALAVHDAEVLADTADAAAAMTLEATCGRSRALDSRVHEGRGLKGQIKSAANIRNMIASSQLVGLTAEVQDAYSVRCAPQVHGASRDAISYAHEVVSHEINAATDNPLFFLDGGPPEDSGGDDKTPSCNHEPRAFSAGNFHGQPVGMAADFLAIGVAELANISERRTQMLLDRNHNRRLPPNLVANGGANSGYMIAQYTAAALVSENKIFCHPSSVDSIPTSANVEDHVAMATTAARKVKQVLNNVRAVLAIELMVGTQALEWRLCESEMPTDIAESINNPLKSESGKDQREAAKERQVKFSAKYESKQPTAAFLKCLGAGTRQVYQAMRTAVNPMIEDDYLEKSFVEARKPIANGAIAGIVRGFKAAKES